MKSLQLSGLVIFVVGFATFLASFFLEKYILTQQIIEGKLDESSLEGINKGEA